jgi:hypothetical protein
MSHGKGPAIQLVKAAEALPMPDRILTQPQFL